jgi:hypothetical protein
MTRGKKVEKGSSVLFVVHRDKRRSELLDLPGQPLDIGAGGECHHPIPLGELPHDVENVDTYGAGRTENGESFHQLPLNMTK